MGFYTHSLNCLIIIAVGVFTVAAMSLIHGGQKAIFKTYAN